jgi:NADH-quinone oxidoreductase subunit N
VSSPIIWIFFPASMGVILFLVRRWHRVSVLAGTSIALSLAGLALILPLGRLIRLGPVGFRVLESLDIFGRHFALHDHDRSLITISFGLMAFWFAGSNLAKAGRVMVPFGLVFGALMIAAFSVEPYLYGAILIEIAVIVCIPILIQSSSAPQEENQLSSIPSDMSRRSPEPEFFRGTLRFLTLQTMGMPFLLMTGWVLTGIETTPGDETIALAASMAGLGFMLLLAVFPFHTWVLMIIEKYHPYVATFIFVVFFWFGTMYALRFMDQFFWLRQAEILNYLRIAGLIILVVTGSGVIFERHLGRMLGYAILMETGYILLAIGLNSGLELVFQMLLPRALSFGTWALALGAIRDRASDLHMRSVRGLIFSMPVTGITLILAQWSIAGLPLLAAFPIRYSLWIQLASHSVGMGWLSMAGFMGLFVTGLRLLFVFLDRESQQDDTQEETWQLRFLLSTATLIMVLVGLFPQLFLPIFNHGIHAFTNLAASP